MAKSPKSAELFKPYRLGSGDAGPECLPQWACRLARLRHGPGVRKVTRRYFAFVNRSTQEVARRVEVTGKSVHLAEKCLHGMLRNIGDRLTRKNHDLARRD